MFIGVFQVPNGPQLDFITWRLALVSLQVLQNLLIDPVGFGNRPIAKTHHKTSDGKLERKKLFEDEHIFVEDMFETIKQFNDIFPNLILLLSPAAS